MATIADVLRARRRRRAGAAGWNGLAAIALGACAIAILAVGVAAVGLGRVVFGVSAGLPDASALANRFGPPGEEVLRPTLLFDRTGEVLLAELGHPLSAARTWQPIDRLPPHVAQAVIAVLEPEFWSGSDRPTVLLEGLVRAVAAGSDAGAAKSVSERLGEQTLLPPGASRVAALLLAADLDATVPRSKILETFLNTADFGHLAFGIDAAALVYFGKHADELTVGEAAALAAVLGNEGVDLLADEATARRLRDEGLAAMVREGWLSSSEQEAARREPLELQREAARRSAENVGFVDAVWKDLTDRFGSGAAAQGGGRIITTLDLDLQLQADCVVRTHLARMAGEPPTSVAPAADGSPCVAASFLPPVRPGDAGVDHGLDRAGLVVLDPASGEILALVGPGDEAIPSGGAAAPFVYLGALARGYTPATMLAVPTGDSEAAGGASLMRLRTAMASGTAAATRSVIDLIGAETAARTLERLGLEVGPEADSEAIADGRLPVRLIDLAGAFGALAHEGVQVGASPVGSDGSVNPVLIREVRGADGQLAAGGRLEGRAVLSEGLAYLMTHMLADEPARWPRLGAGNLLEIGRPAGAAIGSTASTSDNWAAGFSPQRVVVSWAGAAEGDALAGVHAQNGAAPMWHAIMRYAHRSLPSQDWERPPDVAEVEVCDPSGYLATPYCPEVVQEVFLPGTEPTYADSLYRPFRINRETGRLATYFTPFDQTEERVYFVPPPEAGAALGEGVERPPDEYDRITPPPENPDVALTAPSFFETVSGIVEIRGSAAGEDFASYRLDTGAGLDPQAWFQIGGQAASPVTDGVLGQWDTTGRNGAHILRLTVVRDDGTVEATAVPVTVDNMPPQVQIVLPPDGWEAIGGGVGEVVIEVEAADETGLDRIVFYVDDRSVGTRDGAPWSVHWPLGTAGEHRIRAQAFDRAGNSADSEEITIRVER